LSLLKRVERAQQLAAQSEAGADSPDVPPSSALPVLAEPPPGPTAVAVASPPVMTVASPPVIVGTSGLAPVAVPVRADYIRDIRVHLQDEVIATIGSLLDLTPDEVRDRVEVIVDRIVDRHSFALTRREREQFVEEMVHEITGLGPLEPLLSDETITEVMVNGPKHVYIERGGKIQRVDVHFLNDEHVRRIIDRIITPLGRRIDDSSPRVDARLPDGSRVNAVVEPLSLIGPVITVRKFSARPYTVEDLISFGTASAEMFEFLQACIAVRLNVFVSGGTGSGKTTTLNVLSSFIPEEERIITIEDAAELQLNQSHVVTLEARPPNLEGSGEITIRDLLRNALHMRPDRIIVGECRSGEALDMLQAMTTGQDGSLSTGHANSPRDMLRRLETMVLMTGYEMPLRAIREQIASAVDIIVHTARLKDGTRKVINITEVYGIEEDEILTHDIFTFDQTGMRDGKVVGDLKPTGIRPTFMPRFKAFGVELPPGEYGIPPDDPDKPTRVHRTKSRFGAGAADPGIDTNDPSLGSGRAVLAGGMVYISSVGPVDPDTGQLIRGGLREQARQCLRNLRSMLEANGSSLEHVVWANWTLRDPGEFDTFNEEWVKAFPGFAPVGQCTMMPPLQRRAGFHVSIGVIAEATGAPTPA
jgi:pilus assembly protein CpaF